MFQELFDKNGVPSSRKITQNPDLVKLVKQKTIWVNETAGIAERLWLLSHQLTNYPKQCKICSKSITAFRSWTDGYKADYCSKSCARTVIKLPRQKMSKEDIQEKRINTSRQKYGVDYPWQSPEIITRKIANSRLKLAEIWQNQLLQHNIIPLFNLQDYLDNRQKLPVKCSICNTEFQLSRFTNIAQKIVRCPSCFTPKASKSQHEIAEFIKSFGIQVQLNCRSKIHPYEIDIYIPECNVGIEYDGLYWHSERGRPDIKEALTKKLEKIQSTNLQIIMVNEYDWQNSQDIVKSRIASILGKNKRVFARNTTVKKISKKDASTFLKINHLQGTVGCSSAYGLFYSEKLIAVMTFGKPRFAKAEYELLRYASKMGINIVGGGSKLLNAFILDTKPSSIISYADKRWGNGKIYEKMGFEFDGNTGLGFFYVSSNGHIVTRSKAQKHKLKKLLDNFDGTKSEQENMNLAGYSRFWTPGNSRWILKMPTINL